VVCIGLHRKSREFITCVVNVMYVENFRPKVAYHPEVVRRLKEDARCWFKTQEDAEKWAAAFPGQRDKRCDCYLPATKPSVNVA
jgi:hypothetical protein